MGLLIPTLFTRPSQSVQSQGQYMLWSVPAYQSKYYDEYINGNGKGESFSMAGKKYYAGSVFNGYQLDCYQEYYNKCS